eukprot:TRINITY_DN1531_c0_g1_i1.p1 TRINITY_DN1531_c0_g1~~TRINITY_DN1531_c0_g1_i1.p1  ORF type:complete len:202 (-),score=71.61 TRINITY_DN1531_c0_g1_i1:68-673(-)
MSIFKRKKPEEKLKEWKREVKRQERAIDRAIVELENEEKKTKIQIKTYAKKGEHSTAKLIAKQLVKSKAAKHRLLKTKAQLQNVHIALTQQLATAKTSGALNKSADIMASMNKLAKTGQIAKTMQAMQREMEKAGLIDEMIDDALDDDVDDIEDEAEAEVEKIYDELALGVMSTAGPSKGRLSDSSKEDEQLEQRMKALNT